jgi:4-hydroxy-4-methyl-2-oxoglutarate aldolase
VIFNSPERVAALTPLSTHERFADGRPRVPDEILERMRHVTNDEAWGVVERGHNYHFQFEGNWVNLHPDRVLVGRAVTVRMVPLRPDLQEVVEGIGAAEGRSGGQNTWVIDTLVLGDVLVVDLFGKIEDGTFIGDNLGTAIAARAGTGLVVDGGIRDLERVYQLPDFNVFCRGVHPSAILDVTLAEVNGPIRIGNATVMPGDIVLGAREGVSFIPPHLAEAVVTRSEDVRQRDVFGKSRIADGIYTSGQIDVSTWAEEIEADYVAWCEEQGVEANPRR